VLEYPEYDGNSMYRTLGNISRNPTVIARSAATKQSRASVASRFVRTRIEIASLRSQ
jgi:hypothetical protein